MGAGIVPNIEAKPLSVEDLRLFAEKSGQLSQKWWPECVVLLSRIPKGPTGKPLRINFAERYSLPALDLGAHEQTLMWDARCEGGQETKA